MTTSHMLFLACVTAGSFLLSHIVGNRSLHRRTSDADGGSSGYEPSFFGGDTASGCDGGSDGGGCGGD